MSMGPLEIQPHPHGAILNFLEVKEGCCQTGKSEFPFSTFPPQAKGYLRHQPMLPDYSSLLATNSPTLDGQWQLVPWLSEGTSVL